MINSIRHLLHTSTGTFGLLSIMASPGTGFISSLKRSFVDVPVDADRDNAIATTDFLEAAESLTTLFGS